MGAQRLHDLHEPLRDSGPRQRGERGRQDPRRPRPHNHGRTCAKGDAGFEGLTDPDRITIPLRRTNPEKGVGVDPGWMPISWDEALDEIAGHLRDTIADDPEKILYTSFDIYHLRGALGASCVTGLGMPGYSTWSAAIFCGNNMHGILYMNQNAFESNPDPIYSRYEAFNNIAKLREPYKLDPDGHYSYFEIRDRWLKNTLGEDKGSTGTCATGSGPPTRRNSPAVPLQFLLSSAAMSVAVVLLVEVIAGEPVSAGQMVLLAVLTAALLVTVVQHLVTRTSVPGKKESLDRLVRGQYRGLFVGFVVAAGTALPLAGAAASGARDALALICCVLLVPGGFWLRLVTLRVGIYPPLHIPSVHGPRSAASTAGG